MDIVASQPDSVGFRYLTSEEVRRISVKQVVNPVLFDNLNQPNAGGLYDPAFGPINNGDICATCRLNSFECPGHFGHIELPVPTFHPLYITQVLPLFKGTCTYCHHFLLSEAEVVRYCAKLTLVEHGFVAQADAVDAIPFDPESAFGSSSGAKKQQKDTENVEDKEQGEETVTGDELLKSYRQRLATWVALTIKRHESEGRDSYKKSGAAYDKRKRIIAEFLKAISRKRCDRCGAHTHRLKKEGHTKIIEYSLVPKQKRFHQMSNIVRPDVLASQARESKEAQRQRHEAMAVDNGRDEDGHEGDDGETTTGSEEEEDGETLINKMNAKFSRKGRQHSGDEDEEAEKAEAGMDVDEDEEDDQAAQTNGKGKARQTERIVQPDEIRAHLRRVFQNERHIVNLIYAPHGPLTGQESQASPDIFFLDVICVPPSRFRPASTMGDTVFENAHTSLLNGILRQTIAVRDLNVALQQALSGMDVEGAEKPKYDKTRLYTMLLESLVALQVSVNSMIDSTKNPMPLRQGKLPPMGVKQVLEKKEGLFRQNMMGKRVNYAARSVISPDVNIETNEIGVPPVMARKLTFPEPVTDHNIQEMRQLVINGPYNHPGASFIQLEDGNLISLANKTEQERTAEANKLLAPDTRASASRHDRPDVGMPKTRTPQINTKVYRHLRDGDIVILNRQPTLHKPSMMCHRVRVLNGEKTIRMHYANCNSYNADFDGDEMNMHFPQSLPAQAEARFIANTDNQYLVPTSGNPLRGLIQDHVVAGVWLTNKETFFTREEYQQLIYGALRTEQDYSGSGMIVTVPPCTIKPQTLWSGKQVIATVLKNITPENATGLTFACKAKVPGSAWGIHAAEEMVHFFEGEYITGILDKAQIGASAYGLVHTVHELYGPEVAGKLLSILSRLLTKFLQMRAFTCRMDDLILTSSGNADRRELLTQVNEKGLSAALQFVGLEKADRSNPAVADDLRTRLEEVLREDYKLAGLDATVEGETNQVTTKIIKTCLPNGLVRPFPHNHMQAMTTSGAKGSNVNASQISCLLGQQSLEGRRVPTMVSGKTLPSFKAFETAPRAGGFVAGRFLTGIRPQEYYFHCMAGREGLIDTAVKTSRSGYLQRCLIKHLEGLRVHYDHTVRNSDHSILQFRYGEDGLDVTKQKHLTQFEFSLRNSTSLIQRFSPKSLQARVKQIRHKDIKKALLEPETHQPILAECSPSTHLGAVSERFAAAVEQYVDANPQRLLRVKKKHRANWPAFIKQDDLFKAENFRTLMYVRYLRSLVDPGEAVGLVASQGVGEPSTQMTLNTFHFAGHGAANVTLGIPRLREIVMTASQKIKTPTMQMPVSATMSDEELEAWCQKTSRLTLSQVVDEVTVREELSSKTEDNGYSRQKTYTVRLQLYSRDEYEKEYNTSPLQIFTAVQDTFVPLLDKAILKEMKQAAKELQSHMSDLGKAQKTKDKESMREDVEDDAEDGPIARDVGEMDDNDAGDEKRDRQKDDQQNYDSDEESEMDEEAKLEAAFKQDRAGSDSDSDDDSSSDSDDDATWSKNERTSRADLVQELNRIANEIPATSRYVDKVRFDISKGEWCELDLSFASRTQKLLLVGIVEACCRQAVVREVPGISRCFIGKRNNPSDPRVAIAEGINLKAFWEHGDGVIDINKVSTNDIGAILRTYGVEAARTAIIKEMSAVFSVYGIGVDYRHLTIIADYMTSEGGYKPFNRTGLSNNTSPFLKASYETTANFVADATLYGDFDDVNSPSASIVLGQTPRSGTGVFSVRSYCPPVH